MRSGPARHPDELTTAAYLDGTLGDEAAGEFERHLARCADCRAGVTELRMTDAGEPVPPELLAMGKAQAASRRVPSTRVVLGGAAAAVLVAALIAGLHGVRQGAVPASETQYRAGAGDGMVSLAPAAGTVARENEIAFRWTPRPDADRYLVTLVSPDGSTLATLEARPPITEAVWPVPPGARRPAALLWRVRAMRGDRSVAETRLIAFEIR